MDVFIYYGSRRAPAGWWSFLPWSVEPHGGHTAAEVPGKYVGTVRNRNRDPLASHSSWDWLQRWMRLFLCLSRLELRMANSSGFPTSGCH